MPKAFLIPLLLLASCAPLETAAPRAEHVVVVSIDGLRPEFYLGDYEAPTLKAIASAGAHAKAVQSVYPSSTYPAHATLITGVSPARHGIYANTLWTEQGSSRDWYWYAKDLKARTLWDAARERNLTVAITYWPSSVGATATWVMGEIWDPDAKETVKRLAAAATPGLLGELMFSVGVPQEKVAVDKAAIDAFVSRSAAYIFRKYRPNLQFVHLLNVDETQHKLGPEAPAVREAVRVQDENIGRIRKAIAESGLGPKTALVVVGDHGFTSIQRNFGPNTLLRDAGLLAEEGGKVKSWRALVRSSGGSAAVYVKDEADVARTLDVLLAGSTLDGRVVYEVLRRPQLDRLGYNPEAAFALDPTDGWALTERIGPSQPTVMGNHGQLPSRPDLYTGCLLEGAGVRRGGVIGKMRLVDVAPTVAELLGLDFTDVEGSPVRALLKGD